MKRSNRLGELLKAARIAAGLTQGQVANKLNLSSPQYISNSERGLCGVSPTYFRRLAKLLRVDLFVIRDAHLDDYEARLDKKLRLKRSA